MIGYKFDRKTFNPIKWKQHAKILGQLRKWGHNRLFNYVHYHNTAPLKYQSNAFQALRLEPTTEKKVYLDLACGDSPDVLVALDWGYDAWGIDLCLPTPPPMFAEVHKTVTRRFRERFIQADIADGLPFISGSVDFISCHAALALLKSDERALLYTEVKRVLKPDGLFALTGQPLNNGYGYNNVDESSRLWEAGLKREKGFFNAMVFRPRIPQPRRSYTNCTQKDFKKGDRVQPSQKQIDHFWSSNPRNGTVTGFSLNGRCIGVRLDGHATSSSWYAGFWEPLVESQQQAS